MKKKFFIYIVLLFVYYPSFAQKSIPEGSKAYHLIEQALQHIYNTEVQEANRLAEQIHSLAPGHPVYPMLKALAIREANNPIDLNIPAFDSLRHYLYEALEKSENMLKKEEDQPEANFFAMASYGWLAMYENQDGNAMKAVGLAKDAYKYLKKGFKLKEKYPEFYFTTGLYNYYREKYPDLHPVYKPFMLFFKDGDIPLGLEQIEKSSRASVFMQAEAKDYLSHIYLRYEDQPETALKFAQSLVRQYPKNLFFVYKYVDAAIASQAYQGLDTYIDRLISSDRRYYQMVGQLFRGMLLEKRDNNFQAAEKYYVQSLSTGSGLEVEGAENYRSYAYSGMARVALHKEKYKDAERLYKQALSTAQYPQTEKEPKAYLN